jgi:SOS-response transcriptional repressor LexA
MINRSIEPSDGCIVVVNLNGESLVKRLRLGDGGSVVL